MRSLVTGLAGLVFFLGFADARANSVAAPSERAGSVVTAIEFSSPVAIDAETFRRHLPLQEGEPFDEQALRGSVEWLRDKEIFAEVDVERMEAPGSVRLRFDLTPLDFVVAVDLRGVSGVAEDEVLRRARIRPDETLSEVKEAAVVERLRAFYADRGYPDAEIRIEREPRRPGRIGVTIHVAEGEPVILWEVDILGAPPGEEAAALAAAGARAGDPFRAKLPAEARDRLVRFFRSKGYYEVDVREHSEVVGRESFLVLDVRPGPRFEILVEGNRVIGRDALLALANLERRPIVTDGTWRVLARRMEEEYRSRGYRFAEVESAVESGSPKRVRFRVDEGPRVHVRAVRFEGVDSLDSETLREALELLPSSPVPFSRPERWLLEEVVASDRERIADLYRSRGRLEARVRKVRREYGPGKTEVTVVFEIEEGPLFRVVEVEVLDREGVLSGRARPIPSIVAGEPLSPERLENDRRALAAAVVATGRPDAIVESEVVPGASGEGERRVVVRHHVRPGPEVRIGRIVVKQNYFTRDRVIRRELPFRSGDPFDPALFLEAQRRIYRLGLFRGVSVQAAATEGAVRDVIVRVVERPNGELEYGFGYNTRSGLRNFLQVGHRNVLGTGRPVTFRGELNLSPDGFVPDEYIVGFDAREPRIAGGPYDWRSNLVFQRGEREIDEFSIRRFSLSSGFEREFLPGLQGSAMVEFEDSRIFDVAPDVILTGQDRGRLRTVSLNPILVYDGRDDAFAPTRGVFDTFRLRYGTPALGSEVHFVKVNAQHSQYVPLGRGWTWLYAVRAGIAEPLGDSGTIPLRERFFLGGRTSVRGFEENEVGPRGERGSPLGGDLLFSGNLEVRFPLAWGVGGAAFLDGGGLYLQDRAITVRDFRRAAGLGLRYQTPVGAISLDYGIKLDRRGGESIGEVHFTIGNAF